eukprot:478978-Rhodomonas_salina.2
MTRYREARVGGAGMLIECWSRAAAVRFVGVRACLWELGGKGRTRYAFQRSTPLKNLKPELYADLGRRVVLLRSGLVSSPDLANPPRSGQVLVAADSHGWVMVYDVTATMRSAADSLYPLSKPLLPPVVQVSSAPDRRTLFAT